MIDTNNPEWLRHYDSNRVLAGDFADLMFDAHAVPEEDRSGAIAWAWEQYDSLCAQASQDFYA